MNDRRKCGDVVISEQFMLGNLDHIEINCYFCSDSFMALASFGDHLKNKHKQALLEYYNFKHEEDNSSDSSWPIILNKANGHSFDSIELSWEHAEKLDIKPDVDLEPITSVEAANNDLEPIIAVKEDIDILTDDEQSKPFADAKLQPVGSEEKQPKALKNAKEEFRFSSDSVEEAFISELITQLEKYPVLYHIIPGDRHAANKARSTIYNHLKEKFPLENFTELFVIEKLKYIKLSYEKAENGIISTSSMTHYERLSFLKGRMRKDAIAINSSGNFLCTVCNKEFTKRRSIRGHMLSHFPEFRYKCEVCEKQFAYLNQLQTHMRVHTNEKPYLCELCGRAFNSRANFKLHLKIHRKEKNFKCELCPNAYYRKQYLKDHINTHFNIRPEVCGICGKGFFTKINLTLHLETHDKSGELKFKCKLCGKGFKRTVSRNVHIRRHHKGRLNS